jgi:hypothetical protein
MTLKTMKEVMLIRENDLGKKEIAIHTCNT